MVKMKTKYWFNLLWEWQKIGNKGFTIPFLVGSQKYLSDNSKLQDVKELLLDIIYSETPPIRIKYCITTKDIILEIQDECKIQYGDFPLFKGESQSKLFLTSFLQDLGENCEMIIEALDIRYSDFIKNGEYSINDGQRGDYLPEEVAFIKGVFSKLADN